MTNRYKTIKLKKKLHTAWIILGRPNKLNAINSVMLEELSKAIDKINEDANIRCVIIKGEGEKAFSTGADIKEFKKLTPETAAEFSIKGQKAFSKLEMLSKPVIASLNGYVLGGGLELALACDFKIASDHAEFYCPEIKLGFIPAWGGTQRLPLVVGLSNAKRLIMTGEKIQANEALKIGLVDKVVASEKLESETEALAQRLCEFPPEALKKAKRILTSVTRLSSEVGFKKETEAFVMLFSTKETQELIEAFFDDTHQ